MAKNEVLSPKVDVVFQALFGEPGSERITKNFLESILEDRLAEEILDGNLKKNKLTKIGVDEEKIVIK